MTLWLDAQLSPAIAAWMRDAFGLEASHVMDLGLLQASDAEIFERARGTGAVLLTKDSDFVELVRRRGAPPRVIWLTCGNTSNHALRQILSATLRNALELLEAGEPIVEISEQRG